MKSIQYGGEGFLILKIKKSDKNWFSKITNFFISSQFVAQNIVFCKIFTHDLKFEILKQLEQVIAHDRLFPIYQKSLTGDTTLLIYLNKTPTRFVLKRFIKNSSSFKDTFQLIQDYITSKRINIRDNIIRTWIYVDNIDDQYADLIEHRTNFFRANSINNRTGYIASTGIGTSCLERNHGEIDLLYSRDICRGDIKIIRNLDIMPDTHKYGVHFERGALVQAQTKHLYISGTASIDRLGNVVFKHNVKRQAQQVVNHLKKIISSASFTVSDIAYAIVYLRNESDFEKVKSVLQEYFIHTTYIVVHGAVCRPDWLIEIEVMGIQYNV